MTRNIAYLACALLVIGACGSKKKKGDAKPPAETVDRSGSSDPGASPPGSAASGSASVSSSDLVWNEAPARAAKPPAPAVAPDPDAVIARYKTECRPNGTTEVCKTLKPQVEHVLLEQMVGLRAASVTIDREWYRVAARADTPQLACLGVVELGFAKERSADDEAAVLAALDNPSPSVRWMVLATQLPVVTAMASRLGSSDRPRTTGTCIDGIIDPVFGPKWTGGYPGAKYRPFASSPKRRWFTTSDSVDKVLAFFTKNGRTAMTESELKASGQQRLVAEVTRMSQTMKPGEEQKVAEQMQQLAVKYSPPVLERVDGAVEVKYVLIAPNVPIAIFKDDVLRATSIVALQPSYVPPDPMAAKATPIKAFTF